MISLIVWEMCGWHFRPPAYTYMANLDMFAPFPPMYSPLFPKCEIKKGNSSPLFLSLFLHDGSGWSVAYLIQGFFPTRVFPPAAGKIVGGARRIFYCAFLFELQPPSLLSDQILASQNGWVAASF